MFDVSAAELLTIAAVALLVFGPQRIPEIARKLIRTLRDVRQAADELKTGIRQEYGEALQPLDEARREIEASLDFLDTSSPSGEQPEAPDPPAGEEDGAAG